MRHNDEKWYSVPTKEIPDVLFAEVRSLIQNSSKEAENLNYLRLYDQKAYGALYPNHRVTSNENRLCYNVVKSVIETLVSYVGSARPKAKFITSGGSSKAKRNAVLLTKFTDGVFYKNRYHDTAREVFRDACIFGNGYVKLSVCDNDILMERVFPNEIIVDETENVLGKVRNLYHYYDIRKEHLAELYPAKRKLIEDAGSVRNNSWDSSSQESCGVIEAWHLGENGKHVISIDNAILVSEDYPLDLFPVLTFRWLPRPMGYYGGGICELLRPIQLKINLILRKIQVHLETASSKVLLPSGSGIPREHMTNEAFSILEYNQSAGAPTFIPIQSISGEYFSHLDRLIQSAYELAGVSQLRAISQKPAGLDSGAALRQYEDIQNKRFMSNGLDFEAFNVEVAKQVVRFAKQFVDDVEVTIRDDSELRRLRLSEIDIDQDSFQTQAFPVPVLSGSPAFQLQTAIEFSQMYPGLQSQLLGNLENTDVKAMLAHLTAGMVLTEQIIDDILTEGKYTPPSDTMNLPESIALVSNAVNKAVLYNENPERIQMLRDWLSQASEIQKEQEQMQLQMAQMAASMTPGQQ